MIQISKLNLIVSPEQFFSTDKMLFVDVFCVGDTSRHLRELLRLQYGAFIFDRQTYLPVTLKGSPENLFINVKNGISFPMGDGEATFVFDRDLDAAIRQKNIYDFSKEYESGSIEFAEEIDFLTETYIIPYQNRGSALNH